MIRVGVVGFGLAGRVFHAPLVSSVEGLTLTAVVERQSNHAAERYPGITTYRTVEELLADKSIDLVVVATPSGTHFDVIRQVLQAGKAVVGDKPLSLRSNEIAELMDLAKQQGLPLIPFHNRRWDGDFLTLQKLLRDGTLGRVVHLESHMDRWNPGATRTVWKDEPEHGGGVLLDLGTHLVDQALVLFGKPLGVSAEVMRERDGQGANDAFTIRLRYVNARVTVEANALSSPPAPRFHIRGTRGNFRKEGVDPQEAALKGVTRIGDGRWGEEPADHWGMLHVDVEGGMVTQPVETIPGNYRLYYAAVRDALLGTGPAPVRALDAWRVARILEWAQASSDQRCEMNCDWVGEPDAS